MRCLLGNKENKTLKQYVEDIFKESILSIESSSFFPKIIAKKGHVEVVWPMLSREDTVYKINRLRELNVDYIILAFEAKLRILDKTKAKEYLKDYKYGKIHNDASSKDALVVIGFSKSGKVYAKSHEVLIFESGIKKVDREIPFKIDKIEGFLIPSPWG